MLNKITLLLFPIIIYSKSENSEEFIDASEVFDQTIGGLFGMFDFKKVVKSEEEMIEHFEAVSRNKFLHETLTDDMNNLKESHYIGDQKAGKLLAILENIEAIEINMKMANNYETRANRLCSIFFSSYEKMSEMKKKKVLNIICLL